MKNILAILAMTLSAAAMAQQGASCNAAATEKKLTGNARTTFVQKCETDAKAKMVVSSAKEKKYSVAPTGSYGGCDHGAKDL